MAIIFTYPLVKPGKLYKEDRFVLSKMDEAGNPTKQTTLNEITKYVSKYGQFEASPYTINGLINNLASAGSGGYDFMEWVSNVTSTTQIPVMWYAGSAATPRCLLSSPPANSPTL